MAYRFGDSYCYVIVFIVIFIVAAVLIILIVACGASLLSPYLPSLSLRTSCPCPLLLSGSSREFIIMGGERAMIFHRSHFPPACHLPRSPLTFFDLLPRPTIPRLPTRYTVIS
jgi:hypothetical protein